MDSAVNTPSGHEGTDMSWTLIHWADAVVTEPVVGLKIGLDGNRL